MTVPLLQRRHKGQHVSRPPTGAAEDTEPAWPLVRNPPCPCPWWGLQLCRRWDLLGTTGFTQKETEQHRNLTRDPARPPFSKDLVQI